MIWYDMIIIIKYMIIIINSLKTTGKEQRFPACCVCFPLSSCEGRGCGEDLEKSLTPDIRLDCWIYFCPPPLPQIEEPDKTHSREALCRPIKCARAFWEKQLVIAAWQTDWQKTWTKLFQKKKKKELSLPLASPKKVVNYKSRTKTGQRYQTSLD